MKATQTHRRNSYTKGLLAVSIISLSKPLANSCSLSILMVENLCSFFRSQHFFGSAGTPREAESTSDSPCSIQWNVLFRKFWMGQLVIGRKSEEMAFSRVEVRSRLYYIWAFLNLHTEQFCLCGGQISFVWGCEIIVSSPFEESSGTLLWTMVRKEGKRRSLSLFMVHVSFTTSDYRIGRLPNPPVSEKQETLVSLLDTVFFYTHQTWWWWSAAPGDSV